ncbi:hypothetical protein [Cupriavidus sp. 8B]
MSIFLESHFLPGDTAELRLACESVTVTADAVTVRGVETCQLEAMKWAPDYLSFGSGDEHHRIKVARPATKPPLRARFPRA